MEFFIIKYRHFRNSLIQTNIGDPRCNLTHIRGYPFENHCSIECIMSVLHNHYYLINTTEYLLFDMQRQKAPQLEVFTKYPSALPSQEKS